MTYMMLQGFGQTEEASFTSEDLVRGTEHLLGFMLWLKRQEPYVQEEFIPASWWVQLDDMIAFVDRWFPGGWRNALTLPQGERNAYFASVLMNLPASPETYQGWVSSAYLALQSFVTQIDYQEQIRLIWANYYMSTMEEIRRIASLPGEVLRDAFGGLARIAGAAAGVITTPLKEILWVVIPLALSFGFLYWLFTSRSNSDSQGRERRT